LFKRLRAILLATMLLATTLAVGVQPTFAFSASDCSSTRVAVHKIGSGTLYAEAFEYANYNSGNISLGVLCIYAPTTGSSSSNEFKQEAFIDGYGGNHCDGQLATSYGSWNDCVSSIQFVSDCHHTLTFYTNSSYDSVAWSSAATVSVSGLSFLVDNTFSSMRLTYHSACLS
jgi:hypothetical protein